MRVSITAIAPGRSVTRRYTQHVRLILKNPVYTGRVAFGRTKQVRIEGTESEYKRVKSKDYIVSPEAAHPAIVSDELFEKAQLRQREIAAGAPRIGRGPKHLLSGILRCPQCGSGMMAEHGRIKKGKTEPTLNYLCGHYSRAKGGQCKKNSILAEQVETEVIEYTKMLVQNPQFAQDILDQIGQQSDNTELEAELEGHRKRLKKLETSKSNLERDIDNIADEDRNAERKRKDMNNRLNKLYDEIYEIEKQIAGGEQKKQAMEQNVLSLENIYKMLGVFDQLFDKMEPADKRKVMELFVAEVQLRPKETWKQGENPVKSIKYTFPISKEVLDSLGGNCKNVVWMKTAMNL